MVCVLLGVLLISLALCADAVIGNVQEKAVRDNSGTAVEVVGGSSNLLYICMGYGGLASVLVCVCMFENGVFVCLWVFQLLNISDRSSFLMVLALSISSLG